MQLVPDRGYALRKRSYKRKKAKAEPSIRLTLPDGRTLEATGVEAIQALQGASLNQQTSPVTGRAGTGPPALTPDAPV